jgi:hypothetical protein
VSKEHLQTALLTCNLITTAAVLCAFVSRISDVDETLIELQERVQAVESNSRRVEPHFEFTDPDPQPRKYRV